MEFPFGHNNKHHNQREQEEEQDYPPSNYPHNQHPGGRGGGGESGFRDEPPFTAVTHHQHTPPPPPHYGSGGGGGEFGYNPPPHQHQGYDSGPGYHPPPPPVQHVGHESNYNPSPPPPYQGYDSRPGYTPPPPVQHVSHQSNYNPPPPEPETHHSRPHFPSISHHQHQSHDSHAPNVLPPAINKPTVRVYSKAETSFSLTIRDDQVVLVPSNPRDDHQHWIKDEKYSTRVKDKEGHPCFALVNKATGQALKHSIGATQPVQLCPYNPNVLDESILWTESNDLGDSYKCIRMVDNILLNLDAFNGDKNHGGVRDGTVCVLWEWKKGDNQRWKIAPHCKFHGL